MNAHRAATYNVYNLKRPVFAPDEPVLERILSGRSVFLIADQTVYETHGEAIRAYLDARANVAGSIAIDGSEHAKTLQTVERVCAAAFDARVDRRGVFLGVGGGVVLDVAGMAAALYRRGIAYVRVPTSLIGMVDVSVGIKQGVNFGGRKNALGAFYPPMASLCHRSFLRSLEPRHLAAGLAEIIKMGLIADEQLFDQIERGGAALMQSHFQDELADEVITRAQVAMMNELEPNLYEENMRRLVDFGHTFSPALETQSNHRLSHGEAVAVDMMLSTAIAAGRSICSPALFERLLEMYESIGLPITDELCTLELCAHAMQETRRTRAGDLNLVVPSGAGSGVFLQHVSDEELIAAIAATRSASVAPGVAS